MKALLVTSQVTFAPHNYQPLLAEVLGGAREHLAGLLILKNLDAALLKRVAGLAAIGCPRIAWTMARNIAELSAEHREDLFRAANLPILRAKSVNEAWLLDWVAKNDIDVIVNARTRCIFKAGILAAPTLGCINIHHGILPRYRGTMCDLWALASGRAAGFTIHAMVEKVDAGDILYKEETSPSSERDYVEHLRRAGGIEGRALARLLCHVADTRAVRGDANICATPVYSKTPQRREIHELRRKGMRL